MNTHRLGVSGALVDGVIVAGDVSVADGRVLEVGVHPAAPTGTSLAVPGFIDLQINGFAGVDFTTTDTAGYGVALGAMAAHGVTACLPTLPTAAPDAYRPALGVLAEVMARPPAGTRALGAHLEGPFLNPARRGAHRGDWLRSPDPVLLAQLLAAGPVRLVTLAPELDGAELLIAACRRAGVVVSAGHSDATADRAHRGFDLGVSMITHLWNAMRPIASRDPGVGGAALARPEVAVGLIADLAHVAADTLRFTLAAAGPRAFVVTDALELAGLPAGRYQRADGRWQHTDGCAVRLEDGTLAGSALALDQAVRNLVTLGLPIEAAVATVTTAPAQALGRRDLGRLVPGARADLVVLDDQLQPTTVLIDGVDAR